MGVEEGLAGRGVLRDHNRLIVGGQEGQQYRKNHHEHSVIPPWHAISIMLINLISVKKHTWARALFSHIIVRLLPRKGRSTVILVVSS